MPKETQKTPKIVSVVPEPFQELLVWQAAARPFKNRNREYYTTIIALVFLLAVILLFLKEWLLIMVIISLAFLAYVLSSVQPEEVEHKLTTRGITTGGKHYSWSDLQCFWFSQKWGNEILNVETRLTFPRRLIFLLGENKKDKIKGILEKYLIFEKPEKTLIDKFSLWLQKKFPLEE